MSNDTSIGATNSGTSIATQIAILQVESEQADYEAQTSIRDAERATKRQHDKEQVAAIRSKAGTLLANGIVTGSLMVMSSAAQFASASSKYEADTADVDLSTGDEGTGEAIDLAATKATATATATRYTAVSTFLNGGAKTTELAFSSVTTSKDGDAAAGGNAADEARARADDANAARQRALSQLDAKLSIAQDLARLDAETMHMLIRPA
jgi:hypothetical protein